MPAPAITGNEIIDGLVVGSWSGGAALVLTYSVPTVASAWTAYSVGQEPDRPGYATLNATQANAFGEAMELWDSYVAARFNETDDVADPGAIRVAITTPNQNEWGYAYLPSLNTDPKSGGTAGDIWISAAASGATSPFPPGGYDFALLLHEIGHTLGLKHPFEGSPQIPSGFDNDRYTVMSYTTITDRFVAHFEDTPDGITCVFVPVNPITPMIFDIFATQSLYGADPNTRAGTTIYTFDPNFAALQTIYDAGGIDTWNLTGHTRPSIIDLREASFSSIDFFSKAAQIEKAVAEFGEGFRSFITDQVNQADTFTWTDNVAIAYGVVIEKVFLGNGDDSVIGNAAANDLRGNGGADNLDGGAGNDLLAGGVGADVLNGGAGVDSATYVGSTARVRVNLTTGTGLDAQAQGDTLTNIENLTGSNFNDILTGSTANNMLIGNAGADSLAGAAGNDVLTGGAGADVLNGGAGVDSATYVGSTARVRVNLTTGTGLDAEAQGDTLSAIENLTGSTFNDVLTGSTSANTLDGGAGNDLLEGGVGADVLNGGAGVDSATYVGSTTRVRVNLTTGTGLDAQAQGDTLTNIENLTGSNFNDILTGSTANNMLIGNAGADSLAGAAGNDVLRGGTGADTLNGGTGVDSANYAGSAVGVVVNLNTGSALKGAAAGDTLTAIEGLTGSSFNDVLTGAAAANTLSGADGHDFISGLGGNDTLIGGAGNDAFIFNSVLGAGNIDLISDFVPVNDTIRLENAVFAGLAAGTLAAAAFRIGAAAADASDHIIYNAATGALLFDTDGNGAGAAVRFATLDPGLGLTNADFFVI